MELQTPPLPADAFLSLQALKTDMIRSEVLPVNQQPLSPPTSAHSSASSVAEAALRRLPASTKLQRMIKEQPNIIVCPGVYDGLSARTALEVGFDAMYMTGAGTSMSRLGIADMGIVQLADMSAHAEMIASLDPEGPPLIADMDTGFGGPMMVARSVTEYIRAGVAGFHIEDQVLSKRCGHLGGKQVVDRETYYSRLRAAISAKNKAKSDIVLIARTDANQALGYEECVERLKYARELGADVGLLEGFTSKEEAAKCAKEFEGWPLLLNVVENGVTPPITSTEAQEMGFRIMIFSFSCTAPAYLAIKSSLGGLKENGIVKTNTDLTPKKLFEVCGLADLVEVDKTAQGSSAANDMNTI